MSRPNKALLKELLQHSVEKGYFVKCKICLNIFSTKKRREAAKKKTGRPERNFVDESGYCQICKGGELVIQNHVDGYGAFNAVIYKDTLTNIKYICYRGHTSFMSRLWERKR